MALNLGVTSCQSLEISLDQFVRGEVLEGSNAYYCEKCEEKVLILHFCERRFMCSLMFSKHYVVMETKLRCCSLLLH